LLKQEIAKELLFETVTYAESSVCRHKTTTALFWRVLMKKESCGACDNCLNPKEKFEGKDDIQLALKTVLDLKQQFKLKLLEKYWQVRKAVMLNQLNLINHLFLA